MGINISRQTDLSENTYLNQFVGKNHIPASNDEFWNSFLQYQIALPTNRYDYKKNSQLFKLFSLFSSLS